MTTKAQIIQEAMACMDKGSEALEQSRHALVSNGTKIRSLMAALEQIRDTTIDPDSHDIAERALE